MTGTPSDFSTSVIDVRPPEKQYPLPVYIGVGVIVILVFVVLKKMFLK